MSNTVIQIENLSKIYRLGEVGTGTLSHDLNRWFRMNILGQDDPYAKIGHVNDRTQKAEKGELVAALQDINLEVKQGEVLGIIGKNGAGKSTLLKLLSRVTSPTTGVIKTKGRLASLLEVGTGFHPEMTGRENIYMNGTIMGMRKWEINKKLDEIVDFAGVAKYLDTPVKRYSSGMTVRLGFAVAAFLEPEILVVDEVLAVGDAEFQKKALGKMQDVSKGDGRTILFVSHNMASIQAICTKAMLLGFGKIERIDSTNSIIEYYLNASINIEKRYKIRSNYVQEVFCLNEKKEPVNTLKLGENMQVRISISKKLNLELAFIGLFIIDSNGDRIGALSTKMKLPVILHSNNDFNICTFAIKKPPLVEGTYYIDISITNKTGGRIEFVEKAISFEVAGTDIYGTGERITSYFGKVFFNFETFLEKQK